MKRYVIEFGMGVDFHGQDVTRAAEKLSLMLFLRVVFVGLKKF